MAERERLNTPGSRKRSILPKVELDSDSFGRFAEWVARFMGTAKFLVWMTILVITWVVLNVVSVFHYRWDPYPFILLNLAFSTQAAYAAPLILLAQNRQEDRDKSTILADRRRAEETKADTEFLTRELAGVRLAVGEMVTRDYLRHELDDLRGFLERLEAKLDDAVASRNDDPHDLNAPTQGDVVD